MPPGDPMTDFDALRFLREIVGCGQKFSPTEIHYAAVNGVWNRCPACARLLYGAVRERALEEAARHVDALAADGVRVTALHIRALKGTP